MIPAVHCTSTAHPCQFYIWTLPGSYNNHGYLSTKSTWRGVHNSHAHSIRKLRHSYSAPTKETGTFILARNVKCNIIMMIPRDIASTTQQKRRTEQSHYHLCVNTPFFLTYYTGLVTVFPYYSHLAAWVRGYSHCYAVDRSYHVSNRRVRKSVTSDILLQGGIHHKKKWRKRNFRQEELLVQRWDS